MKERVVLATLLVLGSTLFGFVAVPPPSANYEILDADAEPLRSEFNEGRGKVRVIVYVSPTCGGCLRLADEVQKKALSEIDDSDLAVYVVWAPRNGAEEGHVERVTGLVDDPRAHQYWDGHGAVADPVDDMLELSGPCAGVPCCTTLRQRGTALLRPRPPTGRTPTTSSSSAPPISSTPNASRGGSGRC